MTQFQAQPRGIFSWGFDLYDGDQFMLTMDMSWLREGGCFALNGVEYTLTRESLWSGDFLLQEDGRLLASASKPSALMRRFIVHAGGRDLILSAHSPFSRRFLILDDDRVVGQIVPDWFFSRACTIDLPDYVPVPVGVFIFWLVAIMWRRAANAAAS